MKKIWVGRIRRINQNRKRYRHFSILIFFLHNHIQNPTSAMADVTEPIKITDVVTCSYVAKSGVNKGKMCTRKATRPPYCGSHASAIRQAEISKGIRKQARDLEYLERPINKKIDAPVPEKVENVPEKVENVLEKVKKIELEIPKPIPTEKIQKPRQNFDEKIKQISARRTIQKKTSLWA